MAQKTNIFYQCKNKFGSKTQNIIYLEYVVNKGLLNKYKAPRIKVCNRHLTFINFGLGISLQEIDINKMSNI